MNESEIIQGRRIGVEELAQVKGLLATQPDWSRWRVSVELAWMWNGRTPTGQLKRHGRSDPAPALTSTSKIYTRN